LAPLYARRQKASADSHFLRKLLKRLQSWRKEDLVFVASGFDFVALALVFLPPEL
jgi:hypothetical protein